MAVDPKYLSDAAHFPGGHAAGLEVPRHTSEIPGDRPTGAQRPSDWRAIVAHRRRDADGRNLLSTEKLTRILDVGSTSIHRRGGRDDHGIAGSTGGSRRVVSGWAHMAGRVCRGGRRDQRRRRRHLQVRLGTTWVDALVVVLADGAGFRCSRGALPGDRPVGSGFRVREAPSRSGSQAIGCRTSSSVRPATTLPPTWI